ncbi:hypothetical protein NDU88_006014 [Pleurodeles waltl]|uniref:Uncharacterized protein n=1 Tax=Pleurodeles waltl TaxID=8319 RepID=A0AAV7RQP1_PLEWA|nr:hypothetical protein NDU88_006014 [Pleurodeles waltl]
MPRGQANHLWLGRQLVALSRTTRLTAQSRHHNDGTQFVPLCVAQRLCVRGAPRSRRLEAAARAAAQASRLSLSDDVTGVGQAPGGTGAVHVCCCCGGGATPQTFFRTVG